MRPEHSYKSVYPCSYVIGDGSTRTLDVDGKWSSAIFTELMDLGGGSNWEKWKQERIAAGLPVVDIPRPKPKPQPKQSPSSSSSNKGIPNPFALADDEPLVINPGKTGAAAVLP